MTEIKNKQQKQQQTTTTSKTTTTTTATTTTTTPTLAEITKQGKIEIYILSTWSFHSKATATLYKHDK